MFTNDDGYFWLDFQSVQQCQYDNNILQGAGLTSLTPTPFSGNGRQLTGTWDIEHSIEHVHL